MTDLLRIADVTVRHGATVALDDLSLAVRRDELFVLLGASGSGKTTLLRAIAGFVPLAAGRIALDGQDIGRLPPHRRPVNTVFQSYALFPHMTAAANIAFGLRQMDRSAAAARVREMLALVRLEALADRRPNQLSGGQQHRGLPYCSWTSRYPPSTALYGPKPATNWCACDGNSAPASSWLPTTSRRL